jgi:AcrR family transcriptional regulator
MSLTRSDVLRAAVHLADATGLPGVTMRRLGDALGVEAMSLYHHVAGKAQLLDAMVDAVFDELEPPVIGAPWRAAMRERALAIRTALRRHPWAIGLMESRSTPGPATLRHHDAVLGCLRAAGFSVPLAGHAYALLDSYVYGFALQERGLPFDSPEGAADVARGILADVQAGEYPHLTEFALERATKPGYDFGAEFDVGLDLILDGLARALDQDGARR